MTFHHHRHSQILPISPTERSPTDTLFVGLLLRLLLPFSAQILPTSIRIWTRTEGILYKTRERLIQSISSEYPKCNLTWSTLDAIGNKQAISGKDEENFT